MNRIEQVTAELEQASLARPLNHRLIADLYDRRAQMFHDLAVQAWVRDGAPEGDLEGYAAAAFNAWEADVGRATRWLERAQALEDQSEPHL